MLGGKSTKTDLITFLDAHVEVTVGKCMIIMPPYYLNHELHNASQSTQDGWRH